jgi:hypothetical protein
MNAYSKTTGLPITGSAELIPGTAEIADNSWTVKPDGAIDFDWLGETDVDWDGQETQERDGQRIFYDSDGNETLESEIEVR